MIDTQRPVPPPACNGALEHFCPICIGTGRVPRLYRSATGVPVWTRGKCSLCQGSGKFGGIPKVQS